ncbi:hypothetical protein MMC27_004314 [Xylographa pallens]|nr:hypothetical protein [Xylographa pallens]
MRTNGGGWPSTRFSTRTRALRPPEVNLPENQALVTAAKGVVVHHPPETTDTSSRATTPTKSITAGTCPDRTPGDVNAGRCGQLTSKKKSISSGITASTLEWTGETYGQPTMPSSPIGSAGDSRASNASTIDAVKRTAFHECESGIEQPRPTSRTGCVAGYLDFGTRGCGHNIKRDRNLWENRALASFGMAF